MSNTDVEQNGVDENASTETENQQSTKLETVSNLQVAVIPPTEIVFDVVRDTDKAILNFTNVAPDASLSELTEDQFVERLSRLMNLSLGLPKMTLFIAVQIGTMLLFKKEQLKRSSKKGSSHGLWMDWMAKNFTAYDDRTARNWMKLAKNADKVKGGALTLKEAYALLRNPRTKPKPKPEPKEPTVAEQITELAKSVEDFTKEVSPEEAIQLVSQVVTDFAENHNVKRFNELFGHLQDLHDRLNAPAIKPVSVGEFKPRAPRKSKPKLNSAATLQQSNGEVPVPEDALSGSRI